MKIFNSKIIILCFVFQSFLAGSVFAANFFEDEDVIWEAGKNEFIKYARQDDSSFGKNDHPVILKVEEISKALGSLNILKNEDDATDQEQRPVFTVGQIDTLSQNLAKGLAKAKPDQDIGFALKKSRKRSLGRTPERLFVAGRAFYKDQKLNIIVGDYNRPADQGFEAAYDPTNVGIVVYHFDHGRRTKSSKNFKSTIVTVEGVENKQVKQRQRPDWLVIDLKSASEASDLRAETQKAEEQARKREELEELLGNEEASSSHPAATAPAPATSTSSFDERLTTLGQLRDKGLISDEEYTLKRKQILEEL